MPKVTDEYLADKRNFILACMGELLKEKPLYLITMRDIIKRAGFSQGVIYRYYSNLDDICVDFINKHTANIFFAQRIDDLLSSEHSEKTVILECFAAMGGFISELLQSAAGKPFFELLILYSSDSEKRNAVFPKIQFKQSIEYVKTKVVEYAVGNVMSGVFRPQIAVESILVFINASIDGIFQSAVLDPAGSDIPDMFETLAKAVINFLEG